MHTEQKAAARRKKFMAEQKRAEKRQKKLARKVAKRAGDAPG